ncbi:MAG: usg protein [Alphaproteobacteria bacterium]
MTMSVLALLLNGYRLTTAEILYHLPDHPAVLQSYIWQEYDLVPRFPVLNRFLRYWEKHLDGKLHSVRVATTGIIVPTDLKYARGEFTLH